MKEINNEPSLASHEKKAKNIFLVSLSPSRHAVKWKKRAGARVTETNKLLSSWINNFFYYPCLSRGVDGGVHGELPSENEPPCSPAECRFRTAFNRLIVELLRLCLKDCNMIDGEA